MIIKGEAKMIWLKTASFLMFVAVCLGAFGSHMLKDKLVGHYAEVYKTAVLYHFIHAMGLFVVAWLSVVAMSPKVTLAGQFFVLGIVLFSGSLYVLSITQIKWVGAITPLGGLSFLMGWLLIF